MYNSARGSHRPGRGTFRGGRGRGRFHHYVTTSNERPQPQLPPPETSQKCLQIIKADEVSQLVEDEEGSKVKNCQYVASYNWFEKKDGTIMVPGLPPTWCPPLDVIKLQQDSPNGTYYRDQNAARYPTYPVDPAVRAVFEINPEYASSDVDVFACASTLGSLLSFVEKKEERTFRFGVERIGNTIFLVRKTNQTKETMTDVYGYGHTFPDAYTSWDESVKGSASNQRIISYDLGGLKCLVRSECDGVLPDKVPCDAHRQSESDKNVEVNSDLTDQLENLLAPQSSIANDGPLTITQAGRIIPQCSIFDLKTRSIKKKENFDLGAFLPKYWINQTPNAIIAWQTSGTFHDIEIKDVQQEVKTWEKENIPIITGLCSLLQTLIQFSDQPGQSRFEVRRTNNGPLEFWSEVRGWSALPRDLKAQWTGESLDAYTEQEEHQDPTSDSEGETPDYLKF